MNSPQSVRKTLRSLRKGDHVTVLWVDASESVSVPLRDGAIHNHSVESVCTSAGTFISLQRGEAYSDQHILIAKDFLDSERIRVQSIPIALVKSVQVFKERKKLLMKRIDKRKLVYHFRDGSVKYVGGLSNFE